MWRFFPSSTQIGGDEIEDLAVSLLPTLPPSKTSFTSITWLCSYQLLEWVWSSERPGLIFMHRNNRRG